jgi:hypothetical protein
MIRWIVSAKPSTPTRRPVGAHPAEFDPITTLNGSDGVTAFEKLFEREGSRTLSPRLGL